MARAKIVAFLVIGAWRSAGGAAKIPEPCDIEGESAPANIATEETPGSLTAGDRLLGATPLGEGLDAADGDGGVATRSFVAGAFDEAFCWLRSGFVSTCGGEWVATGGAASGLVSTGWIVIGAAPAL